MQRLYIIMKKDIFKILLLSAVIWLVCVPCSTEIWGKDFVVVIDAGHGGHDPGALGKISKEKNINLNVALQVGKLIQENCKDVKIIYTRKTDVFIPLDQRAEIANNAKADLFISIHTNAVAKGKTVRGAETFTLGLARSEQNLEIAKRENSVILIEDDYKQRYAGFNPNSSESYIMFEFIQDKHMEQSVNLAKLIQKQFKGHAQRIDRGVHQAGFLVLRATSMPSVLIELGYISTPEEESYLNSLEGIEALGNSIYRAFLNYKKEHEKPMLKDNDNNIIYTDAEKPEPVKVRTMPQTKEKPLIASIESAAISDENYPVFKVQILTSPQPLRKNDNRLKDLKAVNYYKENGIYKYTSGESTDYNQILRLKKELTAKFKDCFIIAFKNNDKMDVREAINEFKTNKNK